MKESLVAEKAKMFAIRIVNLYKYLMEHGCPKPMATQVLRSGTSIGANAHEAKRAQSDADFGAKMNIALKEASETEYWLELLRDTDYINKEQADSMLADCVVLIKMLTSICKKIFSKKR